MTRYKGRHRKPSTAGKTAARVAVTGVTAAVPMGLMTTPALAAPPPDIADAIIQCESGGDPRAQNPSSTASGLFQFINGTWKGYGGSTARAKDASVSEQWQVFERAYAAEGTRPWNASKSCWSGKVGKAPSYSAPKAEAPRSNPAPSVLDAPVGTRGTYTCDSAHLLYELCDAENIGQVVPYPVRPGEEISAPKASNDRGSYKCDTAHLKYELCDAATIGQTFDYPSRKR